MGLIGATRTCLGKYVTFSGRASRPEYWWFFLAVIIVSAIAAIADYMLFDTPAPEVSATETDTSTTVLASSSSGPIQTVVDLLTVLPMIAVSWRRMHDTGRSGFVLLIPLAISLALGAFLLLGVFGFAALEGLGIDADMLRGIAAALGSIGIGVGILFYIIMSLLILWWLTRPSEPGTNAYGPEPAH